MTELTKLAPVYRVLWDVLVVEGNRLRRPGVVGPEEELVLIAAVAPPPGQIFVELYRGDVLRDRRGWAPPDTGGEAVVAMRLGRSDSLMASSRLRCRLLVDGREIGQRTVLLGPPAVDAQGRLSAVPAAAPSEATRLAYVQLLEETWQADDGR